MEISESVQNFWSKFEKIEEMECKSLDELCCKEVLIEELRKEYEAFPADVQKEISSSKPPRNEVA